MKHVCLMLIVIAFFGMMMLSLLSAGCCNAQAAKGYTDLAQTPIKLIAHRGESAVAPENTMASFRTAWRNGAAYAIELDVYVSADGKLICNHDGNLERVSQGACKRHVTELTTEELSKIDVGSFKGAAYQGEPVPELAAVLAELPCNGRIFLEIKDDHPAIPGLLRQLMEQHPEIHPEQISVISFNADALKRLNAEYPGFKTSFLTWIGSDENTGAVKRSAAEIIAELQEIGCTGLDVGGVEAIDADYVQAVHEAGFEFHVWTIDDPVYAKKLLDLGVDSVTTNRPTAMLAELNQLYSLPEGAKEELQTSSEAVVPQDQETKENTVLPAPGMDALLPVAPIVAPADFQLIDPTKAY